MKPGRRSSAGAAGGGPRRPGGGRTGWKRLALCGWLASAALGFGCHEQSKPPYAIKVRVNGDPGSPIEGAKVLRDGAPIGVTDAKGETDLAIVGSEGETISLHVSCPDAYDPPSNALDVRLRQSADKKTPEYVVSCPPRNRKIVVAVRTDGRGTNLPIVHLGRPVGRTSMLGVAHVLLTGRPGETIELTLDTSARPRLRPQNPSAQYIIKPQDDAFIFEQKFMEERIVRHAPAAPPRPTPIRNSN